jgi:hypothetical protein
MDTLPLYEGQCEPQKSSKTTLLRYLFWGDFKLIHGGINLVTNK